MAARDIHERTFEFACRVIQLHRALIRNRGDRTLINQLLRSATSVGANLEEAKAAHSKADFVCKLRIALKEARESHYWLRLISASALVPEPRLRPLIEEANEIVAILTTITKNATRPKQDPSDFTPPFSQF